MPSAAITTLTVCLVLVATIGGCKKLVKEESLEVSCSKSLKHAQSLLDNHQRKLDATETTTITNLLSAAKIEQQHRNHAQCYDKASRAVMLLEQYGKREERTEPKP